MNDDTSTLAAPPDDPAVSGGDVGLVRPQDFTSREPFLFDNGDEIPEFTLRYETYGQLNAARTNASPKSASVNQPS